jgi:hypothetical protein
MLLSTLYPKSADMPYKQKFGAMLNYVKTVLTRVSFDARLFEKELRKAIKVLVAEEIVELKNWCYANFGSHQAILNRCFVSA